VSLSTFHKLDFAALLNADQQQIRPSHLSLPSYHQEFLASDMMQNLLRGSTAKVNDDNDIDRTPEYKRFIDDLAEFHRQRGYVPWYMPDVEPRSNQNLLWDIARLVC
jgi:hypothetical protein